MNPRQPSYIGERKIPKQYKSTTNIIICRFSSGIGPMNGENEPLVTDEQLSLKNNRLKFKTAGELPITLQEFMEYTSN